MCTRLLISLHSAIITKEQIGYKNGCHEARRDSIYAVIPKANIGTSVLISNSL